MWVIQHSCKEDGDEFNGVQVFYHGDGIDKKEIVRAYFDEPLLVEEALQHAMVTVKERLRARIDPGTPPWQVGT